MCEYSVLELGALS